ncbi:MAG: PHP domain-containing protein [Desulfobulbaceae bacterium]|nr:PHP domain-containing protein [Desulfobulbaceae bacterium]
MLPIDLHTHSSCSDGSLTPRQLVREASLAGLAAIALTDHDSMAGVGEALTAGVEYGLEVLPGIEISTVEDGQDIHILGYGANPGHPGLQELISELAAFREKRNLGILAKLDSLGLSLNRAELAASASGLLGRPHIASQLVRQGHAASIPQAFRRFLRKEGRAYVPADKFPAAEAIRLIREAGGLAVLAHPTTIDKNLKGVATLVKNLSGYGLGGLEVFYPGHSQKICHRLFELSERYQLIITGGSDFHGSSKPEIQLGGAPVMPPIPYRFLKELKARLAAALPFPPHQPATNQQACET